jgi:CubicO group peptidase (beta-lactamase class C family)
MFVVTTRASARNGCEELPPYPAGCHGAREGMANSRAKHNTSTFGSRRTWVLILLLAAVLAANGCTAVRSKAHYEYEPPEQLDDGWKVSSLAAEDMDVAAIIQLAERIEAGRYNRVHSCLIVRNDALVYEDYFRGYRREQLHRLYSVTKSVTSALVGIAIGKGFVHSVHEPVISFFPEYVGQAWDHRKDEITLEHLLTMTSGLRYDESSYASSDSRNSHTQMTSSLDWMKWALEEPLIAEPGTRFNYSTANTHLFSGIIHRTSGMYANQFAEEYLFGPLGISEYFWTVGDGYPATGGSFGGLKLRPRDMAKFGYLYLNGGRWNDAQVLPEEWVAQSFVPRSAAGGNSRYGYQWWIHTDRVSGQEIDWFAAKGYGDQFIALFPTLDMLVVITCGNENSPSRLEEAVLTIAKAALPGGTSNGDHTAARHREGTGWIVLEPFARPDLGFSGIVPGGWIETAPGEFARGWSRIDHTILIQQAFPGKTVQDVLELGSAEFGFKEPPAPSAQLHGASLTWDLYTIELNSLKTGPVVLRSALASTPSSNAEQGAETTYLVLLMASASDAEAEAPLLETIFLHAAYALAPLQRAEDAHASSST